MKVSVVLPVYLPSAKHKEMTDKCIYLAKDNTSIDLEWVIVETESFYYAEEADIYIYEAKKTDPNKSINRGFGAASGDFVIFLANDVFVGSGWVECMLACFEKHKDCGVATLGSKEFRQSKEDRIMEEIYFSVAMMKKRDAWLDPEYTNLFDDSDLLMRIYARGQKCYKNLNCIVEHVNHATYGAPDLSAPDNIRQKEYFRSKWQGYKDNPAYRLFIND